MEYFAKLISSIDSYVWGYFLMFLLVGTGLWLTIRMRVVQVRFFKHAWSLITGKWDDPEDQGEITHFQALSTALSATIGTGNIAGVATALASGGPGAVFWMWITAFIGMCTKFTSCLLSQKYRSIDSSGEVTGGPMYFLHNGLEKPWLGFLFALFAFVASFGIGNMVQANSVAGPINTYLVSFGLVAASPEKGFSVVKFAIGIVIAILVGSVILGGIKRIAKVADKIVPFMAVGYVTSSLIILLSNYEKIIPAFKLIVSSAFGFKEVAGGVLGFSIAQTMRWGVARGLFSNEAGLGSAAIAHAPAKTKEPVREGMVAMLGPFVDTIVICTMTALVIIISGYFTSNAPEVLKNLKGADLTVAAFNQSVSWGGNVVSIGLMFFAFSTMVGWSYYGDRAVRYLFDANPERARKAVFTYRIVYVLLIPIGAAIPLEIVWNLSDIANGLMAFPNLIGLIGLSYVAKDMLSDYEKRYPDMKPNK